MPDLAVDGTPLKASSQRPLGGLFVLLNVLHSLALTAGTPKRRHPPLIFSVELERPNGDITDLFIDQ